MHALTTPQSRKASNPRARSPRLPLAQFAAATPTTSPSVASLECAPRSLSRSRGDDDLDMDLLGVNGKLIVASRGDGPDELLETDLQ